MEKNNQEAEKDTHTKVPDNLPDDISQAIRKHKGKIARIVVDREGCIGARSCVIVSEETFQMDDGDLAYVVDPEHADEDTLMMAAQSCPVLAIYLYDAEGNQLFPE